MACHPWYPPRHADVHFQLCLLQGGAYADLWVPGCWVWGVAAATTTMSPPPDPNCLLVEPPLPGGNCCSHGAAGQAVAVSRAGLEAGCIE